MCLFACLEFISFKKEETNSPHCLLCSQPNYHLTSPHCWMGRGIFLQWPHGGGICTWSYSTDIILQQERAWRDDRAVGRGALGQDQALTEEKSWAAVKVIEGDVKGDKQGGHGLWLGRDYLTSPPQGHGSFWLMSAASPMSRELLLSGRDGKRLSPNWKGRLDRKVPSCTSLPKLDRGVGAGTPSSCTALPPSSVTPLKTALRGDNSHISGPQPPELTCQSHNPPSPVLPCMGRATSNVTVGTSTLPTPSPPHRQASLPSLELLFTQGSPAILTHRHPHSLL